MSFWQQFGKLVVTVLKDKWKHFLDEYYIDGELELSKITKQVEVNGVKKRVQRYLIFLKIGRKHKNSCKNAAVQLRKGRNVPTVRITRFTRPF
mmetsp:Transcript_56850/g.66465  ORF Transcript_56850/g.66465 Transcript_56850/m.66465 type:complete len:93 (-) Transcript_56850:123-401(-)